MTENEAINVLDNGSWWNYMMDGGDDEELDAAIDLAIKDMREKNERENPRPLEDWGEDYGDCLWWKFPIVEPPYCGNPLCADWPVYHTHFTKIYVPSEPKEAR